MAIPTISSVSPTTGPVDGNTLVDIRGTGFRLPTEPTAEELASSSPLGDPEPSVRVWFGELEARRVRVVSSSRLLANPPTASAPGAVAIRVENIDDFGAVIEGNTVLEESVVAAAAFTYQRPNLSTEGDLQRLIRTLILRLTAEVVEEVVLTQHTDWDDDPAEALRKAAIAKLPAVILAGPRIVENKVYRSAQRPTSELSGGGSRVYRNARTVDLLFSVGVIANQPMVMLNLVEAVTRWVQANPWIRFAVSSGSSTRVRYELEFDDGGDLQIDSRPTSSNILTATGTIAIRGFDFAGDVADDESPVLTSDPEVSSERLVE